MYASARVARPLVFALTALLFATAPLLADTPVHFHGMLLDEYNAPIAQAHVYVVLPSNRTIRTTTDAKGAFAVLATNLNPATLIVERPGFVPCVSTLELQPGANAQATIHSPSQRAASMNPTGYNYCNIQLQHVETQDRAVLH